MNAHATKITADKPLSQASVMILERLDAVEALLQKLLTGQANSDTALNLILDHIGGQAPAAPAPITPVAEAPADPELKLTAHLEARGEKEIPRLVSALHAMRTLAAGEYTRGSLTPTEADAILDAHGEIRAMVRSVARFDKFPIGALAALLYTHRKFAKINTFLDVMFAGDSTAEADAAAVAVANFYREGGSKQPKLCIFRLVSAFRDFNNEADLTPFNEQPLKVAGWNEDKLFGRTPS